MGLFSLGQIAREHFGSLEDDSSCTRVVFIFIILPLAVSLLLVIGELFVTKGFLQLLVSALSILIGFSINALVLLLRHGNQSDVDDDLLDTVRDLASYTLIIGVFVLAIASISFLLFETWSKPISRLNLSVVSFIMYAISGHFIANILLIPARVYVLVENSPSDSD